MCGSLVRVASVRVVSSQSRVAFVVGMGTDVADLRGYYCINGTITLLTCALAVTKEKLSFVYSHE